MQFIWEWCYVISLMFLQNKPYCTVLNPLQSTCLFSRQTGQHWVAVIRREIIKAATSLVEVPFERYGQMDATHPNSFKRDATNAADLILHGESLVKVNSGEYFTDVLKGILPTRCLPNHCLPVWVEMKRQQPLLLLASVNMSLLLFTRSKTSSTHVWMNPEQLCRSIQGQMMTVNFEANDEPWATLTLTPGATEP